MSSSTYRSRFVFHILKTGGNLSFTTKYVVIHWRLKGSYFSHFLAVFGKKSSSAQTQGLVPPTIWEILDPSLPSIINIILFAVTSLFSC